MVILKLNLTMINEEEKDTDGKGHLLEYTVHRYPLLDE